MITKSRQRIQELHQEPEEVRLQAALKLTAWIGLGIIIISLFIFLPLQLYFNRSEPTNAPIERAETTQDGQTASQETDQ